MKKINIEDLKKATEQPSTTSSDKNSFGDELGNFLALLQPLALAEAPAILK